MGTAAGCAFCEIVEGRAAAYEVLRDDAAVAFLDRRPLFPGHTLLVPRRHHETMTDLPADQVESLFSRARRLATVMETALGSAGSFVAVNNRVSQSVPHLHIHVVPRNRKDGLRGFFWPRTKYEDDDHAAAVAAQLRSGLESEGS